MENKCLLIMAPSAIEADLPKYNELRVFGFVEASKAISVIDISANTKYSVISGDVSLSTKEKDNRIILVITNNTTTQQNFEISIVPEDDIKMFNDLSSHLTNLKNFYAEGIDTIDSMYNLTTLSLNNTNITGDIASLKDLTKLTSINLGNTNIIGDIASLKDLTKLTSLSLSNANITGDIASLKDLTKLTSIKLNNTNVTGDIAGLKDLTKLIWLDTSNVNTMGDVSQNIHLHKLSAGKGKYTWTSDSARSSKTNIPLIITQSADFGDDVDKVLIDEAKCTNVAGLDSIVSGGAIVVDISGNRTSASDSAITTLKANGVRVKINKQEM